jgi:hypothetical protein
MRAEVNRPSPSTTRMKLGTPRNGGISDGTTWYQRKICTSSGMLRKSSVHALPRNTRPRCGAVRSIPMIAPKMSATPSASSDTDSVQPQAESSQSR